MSSVIVRPAGASAGLPVTHGAITMPRTGAWHATLHLASEVKLSGRVEIKAGAGLSLVGTVNRAGLEAGGVRIRVVAGADGLRQAAKPRHYTSPVVRMPLDDLARDAGESLSPTCDAEVLNRTLLAWTTLGVETGAMMATLMDVVSGLYAKDTVTWRFLGDGTLWAGRETWPASGATDFRIVSQSPEDDVLVLGVTLPEVLPGTTLLERHVDTVEHTVTPDELLSRVWLAQ